MSYLSVGATVPLNRPTTQVRVAAPIKTLTAQSAPSAPAAAPSGPSKTLLIAGAAVLAGGGYWLWKRSKK